MERRREEKRGEEKRREERITRHNGAHLDDANTAQVFQPAWNIPAGIGTVRAFHTCTHITCIYLCIRVFVHFVDWLLVQTWHFKFGAAAQQVPVAAPNFKRPLHFPQFSATVVCMQQSHRIASHRGGSGRVGSDLI